MGMTKKRCPKCKKKRLHLSIAAKSQGQLFSDEARKKSWFFVDGQMICHICAQNLDKDIENNKVE